MSLIGSENYSGKKMSRPKGHEGSSPSISSKSFAERRAGSTPAGSIFILEIE